MSGMTVRHMNELNFDEKFLRFLLGFVMGIGVFWTPAIILNKLLEFIDIGPLGILIEGSFLITLSLVVRVRVKSKSLYIGKGISVALIASVIVFIIFLFLFLLNPPNIGL